MRTSITKLIALCSKADLKRLRNLLFLTLAVGILEIAGIASIIPFLQLASSPDAIHGNKLASSLFSFLDITDYRSQLVFSGWCVLIFITLSNLIAAFSSWIIQKIGWTLSHTISIRIVKRYLSMPYEFYLQREIAELIKSTIDDINNLVTNVMIAACRFLTNLAVILVIVILLAVVDPVIALATLLLFAGAFSSIFLLRKNYISNLGRSRLRANSERYTSFVDLLNGIKTIQASNAQKYFYSRFNGPSQEHSLILPKLFMSGALPKYVIETLVFSLMILLVIYLTRSSQSFTDYLPVISLYAFAGYRLLPSINNAYVSATAILSHHHVIDSIYQDFMHGGTMEQGLGKSLPFLSNIEFENVTYHYANTTSSALNNISFSIKKGEKVAFVGTSGSGKSTLGAILVGLMNPTAGSVVIDKTKRSKSYASSWIDQIGYVPQEVFLYNATVTENVCFGLDVCQRDVVAACKIAQIHNHISEKLPDGYESLVGDKGIRLSGGQKQRIGLARALYRNPKLLLLDEATSALDTKTEKNIFNAIYKQYSDTTIVIIAHRVSTVKRCDKIVVLDEGELIAEGTFDELVTTSTLFRELSSYI